MAQPDYEALEREVRELAERVGELERYVGIARASGAGGAGAGEPDRGSAAGGDALAATAGLVPLVGRALLGLAGAYGLRAFTESGYLPASVGAVLGTLYALAWLAWAARTPAEHRLETALHSLTSAMVLAPLVWEATVRMGALTPWAAALILLIFMFFGLAVSWRKALLIPATITTITGCGTAAGLLVATHDVMPFTVVFLATAALIEISACLEHWLSERWLAASTADLSVLLATWLVTNERGLPAGYAPISHGALLGAVGALVGIYLSSTIVRTLLRGFRFTAFETAQCGAALAIAVNAALRLSEEVPALAPSIGLFALVCAAACYAVAFLLLERRGGGRNFYTYSTFGILLALAGTWVLLPANALAAVWAALAVACVWAGGHHHRATLQWHGAIYLVLALVLSGAWLGSLAETAQVGAAVFGALAATLCYAVRGTGTGRNFDLLRLVIAGAAVWQTAGMVSELLSAGYHGVYGPGANHAYCAALRTGVLALGSLALAWTGSRWPRPEWPRLVVALMIVGGYRLLMVDAHEGSKPALVISMLLYGGTLMMLPKLMRKSA
jgi:hypothetical protein